MDRGQLLENWGFSEIHKVLPLQISLKFWRSKAKAEVDFVIEHAYSVYALEVKFTSMSRPKLSRSAWSFLSAYKPEKFAVLNMALEKTGQLRYMMVDFITPKSLNDWLADIFK
jgi:predicted AAA+ superfamily ATPase